MVDPQFALALSCLIICAGMGMRMAWKNLHDTERIEKQLEARRAYKREKNRRLARFYGIDLDRKD